MAKVKDIQAWINNGEYPATGAASVGAVPGMGGAPAFPGVGGAPWLLPPLAGVGGEGAPLVPWSGMGAFPPPPAQQPLPPQQPPLPGTAGGEDEDDDEYRPFTPPPPRERLSYTRYQLELLNGIYQEVRYPNSTQKQLIAKRVGITREQVKIWFQNRRRKDVVTTKAPAKDTDGDAKDDDAAAADRTSPAAGGKTLTSGDPDNPGSHVSTDSGVSDTTSGQHQTSATTTSIPASGVPQKPDGEPQPSMVSPIVLKSIVAELNKFDNEYLKQKKSKKKSRSRAKQSQAALQKQVQATALAAAAEQCKVGQARLFQRYDMIAPPNKVTPTAFLNTSANRFKHASGGTSAFQNPREGRPGGQNDPYSGFPGLPSAIESSELFQQQRSTLEAQLMGLSNPQQQTGYANLFPGSGSTSALPGQHYDNLPVLTDLLGSYKNHAAAAAHRQLEQSLMSTSQPGTHQTGQSSSNPFGLPPSSTTENNSTGSANSRNSSVSSTTDNLKSPSQTEANSTSSASSASFPPSPSQNPYQISPHHSSFNINRVFPFPLIAEPPSMLSSLHSADPAFRSHAAHQWPSSTSTLRTPPAAHAGHAPSPLDDPYRPLRISSLSNPYLSHAHSQATSAYTPHLSWAGPLSSQHAASYTQL